MTRQLLARHPKVRATTERAAQLWRAGEKVVIFCHYRATERALRQHISTRLQDEIVQFRVVNFSDLLYARSEFAQMRRRNPDHTPKHPVLFGEREGRIAKANHGKDPLFFFAALQRQLGYPVVPRPTPPDPTANLVLILDRKLQQFEARLKLLEGEVKGEVDMSQFYVKPDKDARHEPGL